MCVILNNHFQQSLRSIRFACIIGILCVLIAQLEPSFARPRNDSPASLRQSRTSGLIKTRSNKTSKSRSPYLKMRNVPKAEIISPETFNQVLECEAGGSPSPTIHWLKDGKKLIQNEILESSDNEDNVKRGGLSLSFTRSRLYLDCISPSDAGTYTCVASTPFNRLTTDTHLKVKTNSHLIDGVNDRDNAVSLCLAKKSYGSPARIHMWTHNRLEMIGSAVQLFCRSNGMPTPVTNWIGPDEVPLVNNEKYQLLENGDLIIKDLSWDDMGNYICVAENQHGSDRTSMFLYPALPEKQN